MTMKSRRRLLQLFFLALLFPPLYFTGVYWYGTYISADLLGVALTDPLTAMEITLAGKSFHPVLWLSALPLIIVALLFGRVFCSYVCPLNLLLELLPGTLTERKSQNSQLPIYILAMVLLLSLLISIPVHNTLSPVYAMMHVLLFGLGIEAILLGIVLLMALTLGRKSWCRLLCPLGAVYGLLGIKRRLFLQVDPHKCIHCQKCLRACSMGTVPGSSNWRDVYNCTNCGDCVDACEQQALHFSLKGSGNHSIFKEGK
ncbi:MAG: 4Fe-4S binding protein [Selenomonas sp.]|nr:4Fe-4S binding protein [Selenomonas sp.]